MNGFIARWKLGWKVLGRCLLFYIALSFVALALSPLMVLKAFIESPVPIVRLAAGVGGITMVICLLPVLLYWAAQWTGLMQGSDVKMFKELKRKSNKTLDRTR